MDDPRRNAGNEYMRRNTSSGAKSTARRPAQTQNNRPSRAPNTIERQTPEMIKAEKRKAAKRRMVANNAKRVGIIMAVVIAISVFLAVIAISCVNDILVIHIDPDDDKAVSVVIEEGMDTNDVINALDDAGAIKNAWFCKLAAMFFGYSDEGYIPRTYELSPSMGLENMLNEIKNNSSAKAKTVTLTFPEGYTVDQIFALLEQNNVCLKEKLVEAMNTVDFTRDYDFLMSMPDTQNRYMLLEGYLFPDTYEFYIGESAESVLKKFLSNFENKWTDDYAVSAQTRRMTVDQIIRLASIVEKEAVGADMPVVASVLFNRLDANMRLECDSTVFYIQNNSSGLSETDAAAYNALYSTYSCSGLPVGAICNPGLDAIEAVLNAPDTDYYYFMHDANNNFHAASSLAEHNYNLNTYGLAD